jgi:hypothetical protein
MAVNYYRPGLGNVGSFQSSGIPWCSSSVNVPASGASAAAHRIDFPYVTKRLVVRNDGAADIRVGFSDFGVRGMYQNKYYFTLAQNNSLELDFKVSRVYLYSDSVGAGEATVIAALTSIDPEQLKTNWSGAAGVG